MLATGLFAKEEPGFGNRSGLLHDGNVIHPCSGVINRRY
jgi:hypothetical protein